MKKIYLFTTIALLGIYVNSSAQMSVKWWHLYSSGTPGDEAVDIASDTSGNSFVLCKVYNGADYDILLIKYNSVGDTMWTSTYDYPGNDDVPVGVGIDNAGYIYIVGNTANGIRKVIRKYDTNGVVQWTLTPFSSLGLWARSMTVDGAGNVYYTGSGTYNNVVWSEDIQTIKILTNGTFAWTRYYDGSFNGDDYGIDITVDASGNVYITGTEEDDLSFPAKGLDAITIKYSSTGTQLWARRYDYASNTTLTLSDWGREITVDDNGDVFVLSQSRYENSTSTRVVLVRYDSFGTFLGGFPKSTVNGTAIPTGIVADSSSGNVYIAYIDVNYSYSPPLLYNAWIEKAFPMSNWWSDTIAGTDPAGEQTAKSIQVDASGNIIIGGFMDNTIEDQYYIHIYDANGNLLDQMYSSIGGTFGKKSVGSFALGANGDIIITGTDVNDDFVTVSYCVSPAANAGSDQEVCVYDSAQFNASGGVSYSWSPTTGLSNPNIANPRVKRNNIGSPFTYIVTVTNANGCSATDTVILTVNDDPSVWMLVNGNNASGSSTFCDGDTVVLESLVSSWLDIEWFRNDTLIDVLVNSITITQSGNYWFRMFNLNVCVDTSATEVVTVNPPPPANAGTDVSICDGANTTLSASGGVSYSWNPTTGLSDTAISNPVASPTSTTTYTVTVTDGIGCQNSDDVIVTVNSLPSANAGTDVSICDGASTTLSASGGVSYSWSPSTGLSNTAISNPVASPAATITYTVTVTDGNACQNTDDVIVTVNPLPTANAGTDVSICDGANTTLSASGGVGYNWSPTTGLSNPNIANPVASPTSTITYTVTVTDGIGCQNSDDVIVTVNPLPSANAGTDVSICDGANTTLSASGGVSYSWNPSTGLSNTAISNPVASPTSTITYTVTVTDGIGCQNSDDVIVTVNSLPSANAGTDVSICDGANTTLSASGGVSYSWNPSTGLSNPNIANPVASPTSTITYTVTVTDGNACQNTDDVIVTVNSLPTANAGTDVSICDGANTTLSASGGVSYSWSPSTGLSNSSIANPVASPAATTTYTVTVTDGNGCQDTDAITVTINSLPTANAGTDVSICDGANTTLSASGGVSYSWSPTTGLSNPNIANPVASPTSTITYTVTVTDGIGCQNSDDVIVTVNPLPNANAGTDVSICDGANTTLSASGGVSYSWSPSTGLSNTAISNPVASPAATITYTVTVTDGNSCQNTDDVIVTVNPLPTANAGTDVSICDGASTTLSATGGVSYNWSPTTGLSNPNIANPVASPAATTTYTVTVTDGNGCQDTDAVTVTVNSLPTANAGTDVSICDGANTTLSASGGVSYSWNPSTGLSNPNIANPIASPTSTITYTVTVTDGIGCQNSDDVIVTVNSLPSANAGTNVSICDGANTTLSASGGVSYSWNPSTGLSNPNIANPVASPASTTTYTVTVTDGNGCVNNDAVIVTVNSLPTANAGTDVSICDGANTTLLASGGVSYSWSPATGLSNPNIANPVASPTSTITYTVTVTDGNACQSSDVITVTVNPGVTLTPNSTSATCGNPDGTASVTINTGTGPYSYLWDTGDTTSSISGLSAGSYTITVTDSNGCTANALSSISNIGGPSTDTSFTDVSCFGGNDGTVSVIASGGTPPYSYLWNTGDTVASVSNLQAGVYSVDVTDSSGCITSTSVTISDPSEITAFTTYTDLNCNGDSSGTASVTANGGTGALTYNWSNGATGTSISNLPAGDYIIDVTDNNGCMQSDTTTISEPAAITLTTSSVDANCGSSDGSATVSPTGGTPVYTYLWDSQTGGQTTATANNLSSGTYSVTITDLNGCTADTSVTVTDIGAATLSISPTDVTCAGGSDGEATVTTTGGMPPFTYQWDDPSTQDSATATGLEEGTYSVTVMDSNGCSSSEMVTINATNSLPVVNIGPDTTICFGNNLTLDAGSGFSSYTWSEGSSGQTIIANVTGTYYVDVIDINGCAASDTIDVNVNALPAVFLGNDTTICPGSSVTLDAGSGFNNYSWSDGSSGQTLNVTSSGNYHVTITDINGCENSDTILVTVDVCGGIEESVHSFTFNISPNPNRGSFNLIIRNIDDEMDIVIYNMLGKVLYNERLTNQKSKDIKSIELDGIPKGVYFLKITSVSFTSTKKLVIN